MENLTRCILLLGSSWFSGKQLKKIKKFKNVSLKTFYAGKNANSHKFHNDFI